MFHTNTVERNTLQLFSEICQNKLFDNFYLAGGTALALQVGHRKSIDLDFFTNNPFDTEEVKRVFSEFGQVEITNQSTNTLQTFLGDVKVDFLSHRYPLINPIQNMQEFRVASIEDIIAMKLNAISNRGAKKDFYDIYFLLNRFNLDQMLSLFENKYENHNVMQVLKSLLYFEDAEEQPEPVLINDKVSWGDVKSKVIKSVNELLR